MNLNRQSLRSQQGVVIVVALFIVALVATLSYIMMARLERDTERTRLLLRTTQAESYAQGSVVWAMDTLRNNLERQKPNQLVDVMPLRAPVNNVDGYAISTVIYDLQGRFNLNNLTNTDAQADFVRLMRVVEPKLSEQSAQELARAASDWVSPVQQQNEYSKYYLQRVPAYNTAHRPMTSASELLLVKGMTPALFAALQPYITALPNTTQVNVQTAEEPVLASLSPGMTAETASALAQLRKQSPIVSAQAFSGLDIIKNHPVPADKITTTSSYFLAQTDVTIEKQHIVLYTLLERAANAGKGVVTVLWQSKNVSG